MSCQRKFTKLKTKPKKKAINAVPNKKQNRTRQPTKNDPKTAFIQQIHQPNLSNKYTPPVCNRDDMEMLTTFGPFDRDATINVMYLSHIYLPRPLIDKWVGHTNAYANYNFPSHKFEPVKRYYIL